MRCGVSVMKPSDRTIGAETLDQYRRDYMGSPDPTNSHRYIDALEQRVRDLEFENARYFAREHGLPDGR